MLSRLLLIVRIQTYLWEWWEVGTIVLDESSRGDTLLPASSKSSSHTILCSGNEGGVWRMTGSSSRDSCCFDSGREKERDGGEKTQECRSKHCEREGMRMYEQLRRKRENKCWKVNKNENESELGKKEKIESVSHRGDRQAADFGMSCVWLSETNICVASLFLSSPWLKPVETTRRELRVKRWEESWEEKEEVLLKRRKNPIEIGREPSSSTKFRLLRENVILKTSQLSSLFVSLFPTKQFQFFVIQRERKAQETTERRRALWILRVVTFLEWMEKDRERLLSQRK